MLSPTDAPHQAGPVSPRWVPALLLLFLGSGCAALIYEVVWFQLLELVIGSSAVSLGVLLSTFMGGMCLGSLALPRLVSPRRHPLRVYGLLELAIGALGILVLLGMPAISSLYVSAFARGLPGILSRGAACALCMLPPTILMGATLPAVARWVEDSPRGVSWLGLFYGGNTLGAVLGSLLAGFYLLRVHDLRVATFCAVALNAIVGCAGLALAARAPHGATSSVDAPSTGAPRRAVGVIHVAIGLSGLTALGSEVVWTRLLSLLLGGTVYTFSIILAVFLLGLGAGSTAGAAISRRVDRPRLALAWCQVLLAAGIAWTAFMIVGSLPYWPVNPALSRNPWLTFQVDVARCLWAVLPPACLWGASFPLALAAAASRGRDAGRIVGGIYAANTLGAIAGAIGFSMVAIPLLGTCDAQRLLIGISAVSGILVLGSSAIGRARVPLILASVVLAGLLAGTVRPVPPGVVGYGRFFATYESLPAFLFVGEGMSSSVAVSELSGSVRNFHVSGKVEASTEPQDMRLQNMLGNFAAVLHPRPRSVLVVGLGAGVTAGSFVPYPDIDRIVICEIEPLVPRVVSRFFTAENHDVLRDPRVELVHDDARHFLLTTAAKFDIITSDPIHPWVKGAAALYTREYFELVKRHLEPGGLVTQWVPLYESDSRVVKSEMATFFEAFPDATVWGNADWGEGYDTVLLGSADELTIDVDRVIERMDRAELFPALESLRAAGFDTIFRVLETYAGRARDLAPWLADAEINRDLDLRLQYLAGLGLNLREAGPIYSEIRRYRTFPADLFAASPEAIAAIAESMGFPAAAR